MPNLCILLIGESNRAEFRDSRQSIERWAAVHEFADADAAATALAEGQLAPDVIVFAPSFPGRFSHSAVDRLRRLAPLARIVGLMGTWCEGEMRSGTPWPGAVRVYWHQWVARCRRELRRLSTGEPCSWMLPPTATEEERLLADSVQLGRPHRGAVLIHSQRPEMAEWLSAACRQRGFATVWRRSGTSPRVEGAAAAIFDATDCGPEECEQLRRLAADVNPAPVIALVSFPRIEDKEAATSAGATVVLSKPLWLNDLLEALSGPNTPCADTADGMRNVPATNDA